MKWMLLADSDYEKILNKNPEKTIGNYDDLRAFENRCSYISEHSRRTVLLENFLGTLFITARDLEFQ